MLCRGKPTVRQRPVPEFVGDRKPLALRRAVAAHGDGCAAVANTKATLLGDLGALKPQAEGARDGVYINGVAVRCELRPGQDLGG